MTWGGLSSPWHPTTPDGSPATPPGWMAARSSEVGNPTTAGSNAMIKGALLSPGACESYGSCNSAPYELGQSTSFWVAAGVVTHTLWTGAAPAMTYPLFAEVWHLTHTFTTGIFATYPIDRRADCPCSATTFPRNALEQS